jgi:hypothetical protein
MTACAKDVGFCAGTHGTNLLLENWNLSSAQMGMYGRLFPPSKGNEADEVLIALASTMNELLPLFEESPTRPKMLHAGYTYLAQFIAHDLTFDPVSNFLKEARPNTLINFRSPRFDLDSVYGGGPLVNPYLYLEDNCRFATASDLPSKGEQDLLRIPGTERAVIADPRNDANLIISQIHLAFLNYHNRVVSESKGSTAIELFNEACRQVRRHYQWIVLQEFLPLIAGRAVVDSVKQCEGYRFEDGQGNIHCCATEQRKYPLLDRNAPFMPIEFSVGAFRFAHSMIRTAYAINSRLPSQILLFDVNEENGKKAFDLRGFRLRPAGMNIEWSRFFSRASQTNPSDSLQLARPIDGLLARPLVAMPREVAQEEGSLGRSLPARDLLKGRAMNLPTGQTIAMALGVPPEFILGQGLPFEITQDGIEGSISNIAGTGLSLDALNTKLRNQTPLWYYVLKEAEVIHKGERLGPVGAILVAEVIIGLLLADDTSFENKEPNWYPKAGQFGCRKDREFVMLDLLDWSAERSRDPSD